MTQAPEDCPTTGAQSGDRPESREMFTEISSLVAALAKALDLPEADTAQAVERGELTLNMARDANGNAFIAATHGDRTVRVYQGAIKRAPTTHD